MTKSKDAARVAPHVAWREVGEEVVILDLNTSVYYSLKDVAASLWKLLAAEKDAEAMSRAIAGEYDVEEDVARRDIDKFLAELAKEKIVVRS